MDIKCSWKTIWSFLYSDIWPHDAAAFLTCWWQCCCCRSPSQQQGCCGAACSCWCPRERASKPWDWHNGWPGWTRCSPHFLPAPAASPCLGWATNAAALLPGPWPCAPHLWLQGVPHPGEDRANSWSLTDFFVGLIPSYNRCLYLLLATGCWSAVWQIWRWFLPRALNKWI